MLRFCGSLGAQDTRRIPDSSTKVLEWLQNPDRLHNMQLKHDLLSGRAARSQETRQTLNSGGLACPALPGVRRERVEFLRGVQVDISCLYKRQGGLDIEPGL